MSPTVRMPDVERRRHLAVIAEIQDALGAARCAVLLAGMETREFVVRELLLTALQQIDRASALIPRPEALRSSALPSR